MSDEPIEKIDFSTMTPVAFIGEFGYKILRPDLISNEVYEECEAYSASETD